jgi:hypothetical protein
MTDLAAQIEQYLLTRAEWVPAREICQRFGISDERSLRATADRPGLLDLFAVSSSAGFKHHRHLPTDEWLPIKHRLRRHAIAELRKAARWTRSRHNILTSRAPTYERHTGQIILPL